MGLLTSEKTMIDKITRVYLHQLYYIECIVRYELCQSIVLYELHNTLIVWYDIENLHNLTLLPLSPEIISHYNEKKIYPYFYTVCYTICQNIVDLFHLQLQDGFLQFIHGEELLYSFSLLPPISPFRENTFVNLSFLLVVKVIRTIKTFWPQRHYPTILIPNVLNHTYASILPFCSSYTRQEILLSSCEHDFS